MIHFYGVSKRFPGGRLGLDDVSFQLEQGEFAFLTGPSGAGKTTLLSLIYRGDVPTAGQVVVNGRNVSSLPRSKIPYLRRTIGVVFQDFRLIERKTVYENVSYLPRILGMPEQERKRQAYLALRRVGLAHRLRAFPRELSGGEQQRVAIARAIIATPEVLVADEPTGNLDPDLSREILAVFTDIHRQGTTVLLATHDRAIIEQTGGRVLSLDRTRLVGDERVAGTNGALPAPFAPAETEAEAETAAAALTEDPAASREPAEPPAPGEPEVVP